jgi:hypothetical protein
MDKRFKEAGGDVNGEFGFRAKRDSYQPSAMQYSG